MKYLLTILLLISLNLSAQKPWKVITFYSSSILLNATGDALNDSGQKEWGHFCNATSVGVLLTTPFLIDYQKKKWGWYIASYVGLRIGLFDYTYNAVRGNSLNYIGGTSTWDKTLKAMNPPNTYLGRAVFLTVGIAIPINELK